MSSRAWLELRRQPLVWVVALAVVASSLMSGWSSWTSAQASARVEDQADRLRDEIERRTAQQCVTAWEGRNQIRTAIDAATHAGAKVGTRVGAQALIGVATNADPDRIRQYLDGIAAGLAADPELQADIDAAVAELPDPTCDLDAARARLHQKETPP